VQEFRRFTAFTALCCLCLQPLLAGPDYFTPEHRLSGVGVDRQEIAPAVLDERTERMIQSQTFAIMRDPRALLSAERISNRKLASIFEKAADSSGIRASLLSAIAYLESGGDPNAVSPAGPRGIMQFSEATARAAGLRVARITRFKTVKERKLVSRKKGKPVYKTVRRRIPYTVPGRDDRMLPERAIPAAANYLARLQNKFGGLDWAIFAYHCGEGCIAEIQPLAQAAVPRTHPSVAAMFFASSPAFRRELYETLQRHMQRDYSPTYWFRVQRAEQLLQLYQTDPDAFRELFAQYRHPTNPERRASNRLIIWLKSNNVFYKSEDDLKAASGTDLAKPVDDPGYFGFSLPRLSETQGLFMQDSPSAIGTLLYIAFETRRIFESHKPKGEQFVPLQVVEFVSTTNRSAEAGSVVVDPEFPEHSTGQVFDIDRSNLPPGEREYLNFVLDDLGWDGYLGFVQVTGDTVHIGCAPSSREFFATVFEEAMLQRPGTK